MSRSSTLILLGVLVLIAPFSGLPLSFLSFLLPVLGCFIAIIGISIRTAQVRKAKEGDVPPVPPEAASMPTSHGVSYF